MHLLNAQPQEHGDHFGICVAGYPEAHPDTIVEDPVEMEKNYWANIEYLKQKVGHGCGLAGLRAEKGGEGGLFGAGCANG